MKSHTTKTRSKWKPVASQETPKHCRIYPLSTAAETPSHKRRTFLSLSCHASQCRKNFREARSPQPVHIVATDAQPPVNQLQVLVQHNDSGMPAKHSSPPEYHPLLSSPPRSPGQMTSQKPNVPSQNVLTPPKRKRIKHTILKKISKPKHHRFLFPNMQVSFLWVPREVCGHIVEKL